MYDIHFTSLSKCSNLVIYYISYSTRDLLSFQRSCFCLIKPIRESFSYFKFFIISSNSSFWFYFYASRCLHISSSYLLSFLYEYYSKSNNYYLLSIICGIFLLLNTSCQSLNHLFDSLFSSFNIASFLTFLLFTRPYFSFFIFISSLMTLFPLISDFHFLDHYFSD